METKQNRIHSYFWLYIGIHCNSAQEYVKSLKYVEKQTPFVAFQTADANGKNRQPGHPSADRSSQLASWKLFPTSSSTLP